MDKKEQPAEIGTEKPTVQLRPLTPPRGTVTAGTLSGYIADIKLTPGASPLPTDYPFSIDFPQAFLQNPEVHLALTYLYADYSQNIGQLSVEVTVINVTTQRLEGKFNVFGRYMGINASALILGWQ
jgi:hypothetical protein